MAIVIRSLQAVLMLAALACCIAAIVIVGGRLSETDGCAIVDDKATAGCALAPKAQAQATVGVAWALVGTTLMIGAAALNGMARPTASPARTAAPAGPPSFGPQQYPPHQQPPHQQPQPPQYGPPR